MALKRAVGFVQHAAQDLLGAGVFCDGLCALTDGVLGQLTWQQETDSGLDLPAGDGRSLVVVGEAGSFTGDALENVVDKAVHDAHGFAGDTGVGVHLLQNLVDVDSVAFLPPPLPLLVAGASGLSLTGLLGAFAANLGWHDSALVLIQRLNDGLTHRLRYLYASARHNRILGRILAD